MTKPRSLSPRQRWGYLPASLMMVLEATGDEELVWRVVGRAGGRQMRVPARLAPDSQLVQSLGGADAERVWTVWRAAKLLQVNIPVMTTALALERGRRLLSLIEGGCTVHEAARRCGMTERGAYKAIARAREADAEIGAGSRQMDLFPA